MRRSGVGTGGGHGMNKVVHSRAPKAEPKPYAKRPSGVSQIGYMVGDHTTNRPGSSGYTGERLDRGRGYATPVGPTDNVKAVGVGGGREVMRSGSQSTHGSVVPGNAPAKSTDILNQFGPDYKAPR